MVPSLGALSTVSSTAFCALRTAASALSTSACCWSMLCGRSAELEFRPFWAATAACSALATDELPGRRVDLLLLLRGDHGGLVRHDPLLRRRSPPPARSAPGCRRWSPVAGRAAQLAVQLSQRLRPRRRCRRPASAAAPAGPSVPAVGRSAGGSSPPRHAALSVFSAAVGLVLGVLVGASCALARPIAASSASAVAATWSLVAPTMVVRLAHGALRPADRGAAASRSRPACWACRFPLAWASACLGRGGVDLGQHLTGLDPVADMDA